jgi:hypothetical protein
MEVAIRPRDAIAGRQLLGHQRLNVADCIYFGRAERLDSGQVHVGGFSATDQGYSQSRLTIFVGFVPAKESRSRHVNPPGSKQRLGLPNK